jgi:hypothetical protein
MSFAGCKTTSQQAKDQLFYKTEYQFIPDRELVNRMLPDDALPDGEDSYPS